MNLDRRHQKLNRIQIRFKLGNVFMAEAKQGDTVRV